MNWTQTRKKDIGSRPRNKNSPALYVRDYPTHLFLSETFWYTYKVMINSVETIGDVEAFAQIYIRLLGQELRIYDRQHESFITLYVLFR